MDLGSWFRRSLWRKKNTSQISVSSPTHRENARKQGEREEEQFGVTEQLRDFVKSFTLDTFKNFHIPDDHGTTTGDDCPTTSANVRKDLSEWQEEHATLVLSKVKEISQLRYVLCPRHLKEREFWRIYFILVKNYVAPYEKRAIQLAKLKRMGIEDRKSLETGACEVEMAEANREGIFSPSSLEHGLSSSLDDDEVTGAGGLTVK